MRAVPRAFGRRLPLVAAAFLASVASLRAATFLWDGGHAGQNAWTMNQNWNPNGAPTNDGTADLVFSGTIRLAPDANGGWSINSLTFDAYAGAFGITGDALTLQGNAVAYALANNSAYGASISNSITIGSSQTWHANTASLTLGGAIALGANTLTFAGAANSFASGAISGTGGLVKSGAGTLTLSGANTYTGGTTVTGGTLVGSTTSLPGNVSLAAGSVLAFDQATSGTYAGVIGGSGSFTKQNAGTLTLASAQTYTGATAVDGGTLVLGTANTLASATSLSIAAGAGVQLGGGTQTVAALSGAGSLDLGANTFTTGAAGTSTTFSGAISGTGGLVKTGAGTLTLSGANTYSGGTTVSGGALQGSAASLSGNIALASGTGVIFDQPTAGSYGGVVSGAGSLTKQNAGTLTLTGQNTYTGDTAIAGGTLALGTANALAGTTAVTVSSGATLQLAAGNQTIGSLAGAGSVALGSATLTTGGTNAGTAFSGAISGTGALVKTGTGTFTLSGANSYSGGTTVAGGTLQGTTASLQGNIALATNSAVTFDQATSGTYAGVVSGTGSLNKSNVGTVTVSGLNTYTGNTTVTGGTLALGTSNALPAATNLTLAAGTTLDLAGRSTQVATFNYTTAIVDFGLTAAANVLLFNGGGTGSGTLTINNFDAATDKLAFASATSLTGGYLGGIYFYGIGAGVLGATGQTIAGYSGTWNLIVPNTAALRTWDGGGNNGNWGTKNNWDGNNTLVGGTTLRVEFAGTTGTTSTVDTNTTLNTLRFASGATTGAFTINASGGSALTFGGSVPSIIQLATNAQTINAPLILGSTTVIETTGAGALTLGGAISGTGGLNKVGANTLILSGANSFDGATTVNAGTVILRHGSALGSTTGGTAVASGATLQLENNIAVGAEALALDGTLRNLSGANSYAGAISGTGGVTVDGGTLTLSGSAANTFTGTTAVNAGQLDLGKSGGATAVAGNLQIGNGAGSATVRLTAGNQISDTSTVTLNAAGSPTLNLNNFSETIGALASTNAAASVQLGSGTLSTGGANTSTTFAGVISGTGGSLTKEGTGTFTLSGANTYTGATTVAAGTLVLQHATALGTTAGGTTVNAGATLQLENNIAVGAETLALQGTLLNASGTNSYAGAISGIGGVTVNGGTLTLSGSAANTFTGTTTVNAGQLDLGKSGGATAVAGNLQIGNGAGSATVRLTAGNQISDTSTVTLNAAGSPTLNLNNFSETIGALASTNTAASVQLGFGTLATGGANTSTAFAGVISGTGGVTKQGTGTFTLSGANTYTGTTTVSAGTLALGASNALAAASNLTLAVDATFSLNGSFSQRLNLLSFSSATIDFGVAGAANYLLLGNIGSTSGLLTISNWSSGSDVFGLATNTVSQAFLDSVYFTGINVGVGAVLSSTPITVPGYGSFYTLTPIPTFTWSGAQNTGNAADLDNWSKNNNWVGGIAPGIGAVKSLIMAGSVQTTTDMDGAYQIKGLLFRSDAGAFTINSSTGDTLTIGGSGIINESASTQTLNVSVALAASQTWNADIGHLVISGAAILNAGNVLTIDGAFNTTIAAAIDGGAGSLVKNGTGTLTLSGANAFTGGLTLNAGVLAINSDASLGASSATLTLAGGTLRTLAGIASTRAVILGGAATIDSNGFDSTLAGTLGGTGSLTKLGAGTLTLSGTSSYSGGTTVSAGTLRGTTTSLQGNIVNSAALQFDQTTTGTYAGVISGTGSVAKLGSGTTILTGANSYTGGTTVSAGTLQGNTTSLQGTFVNQATLAFDQTTSGTFASTISGSGALTKLGSATLTLAGANTYTGATSILAGTLSLGASSRLASTTALVIASGATFDLASFSQTVGSLAGAGTVALGSGTLLVGAANTDTVFGGSLTGTGTLEKIGSGTLTFNASFSFGGELRLNGGTLALSGINLTVGTLRITGNTVLDFGASTASVLSATNIIIENGAILTIANWVDLQDYFFATGSILGLNGGTIVAPTDIRGAAPLNQVSFTGFAANTTIWFGMDRQITPAPEPSTYGAALTAASLALWFWRRRRATTA